MNTGMMITGVSLLGIGIICILAYGMCCYRRSVDSGFVKGKESCKKGQEMSEQEIVEGYGVAYMKIRDTVDVLEIKDNGDEAKATTHLIAAAPDMYEMLEHIEDVLDDSSGCGEISVEKIRKLLKKARGEE